MSHNFISKWSSTAKLLQGSVSRFMALRLSSSKNAFKSKDIQYLWRDKSKQKPLDEDRSVFGQAFTDHMLTIRWNSTVGWSKPVIEPLRYLKLHPSASVLHYAVEAFEGMKAFRADDGRVLLFRPMENMKRMLSSVERICLPLFNEEEFLDCICELIRVDQDWVPNSEKACLYIRPTMISTENELGVNQPNSALLYCIMSPVGPYFKTGLLTPVSLLADPRYVRAAKGGSGAFKLGCNYGPTIKAQREALRAGCQQNLWLHGQDHQITEAGTMNLFVYWINEDGERELTTMPLDLGLVLPGVIRKSLLELAAQWNEFLVSEKVLTMKDLVKAQKENRLLEMFGSGTACVVCPINRILYENNHISIPTETDGSSLALRFYQALTDIQYGRVRHDWSYAVTSSRRTST